MSSHTDTDTDSDSGNAGPPLLRVTGPSDLAHAVPYLLGFHPERSLVLIGLRDKRVVVTARADLADVPDDPTLLSRTVAAMLRSDVDAFVAIVFDDSTAPRRGDGTLAWAALAAEVHAVVAGLGATVEETALVCRGRLWSFDCDDARCCPWEGRPVEGTSAVAAAAAYAGLVALPDRATLAATLASTVDSSQVPRLLDRIAGESRRAADASARGDATRRDRSDIRTLFATARALDEPGTDELLDEQVLIRFAVALRRHEVRDAVWLGVDAGRIDGRGLWRQLAVRLPAPYSAGPLFLFAWASWRHGNGALAGIAADLAVDSDPDYFAADLVRSLLDNALDPRHVPRLRLDPPTVRAARRAARPGGGARRRR